MNLNKKLKLKIIRKKSEIKKNRNSDKISTDYKWKKEQEKNSTISVKFTDVNELYFITFSRAHYCCSTARYCIEKVSALLSDI